MIRMSVLLCVVSCLTLLSSAGVPFRRVVIRDGRCIHPDRKIFLEDEQKLYPSDVCIEYQCDVANRRLLITGCPQGGVGEVCGKENLEEAYPNCCPKCEKKTS